MSNESTDEGDIETLTRTLEKDQVISQWVLHHINSAYYGMRKSVGTVERAVRYLGFRPVCNLVLTRVIGESFSGTDIPGAGQVQQYVMRTSTMAAFIAREMAEELDLDAPATDLLDQLAQTNLVFLFAPQFNPVLKRVASARKKYGKKTYFNLMGPLLNPMPLTHQMIGITDPDDAVLMGYSAKALGRTGVMFVTGDYGEDEVSAAGATLVQVVTDSGALARQSYHPSDFGFPVYTLDAIRGGDARFNAKILRTIWENTAPESYRVVSVLNAALAYHLVTQQPILACRDRVVTELESGNIMRVLKKRLTQA